MLMMEAKKIMETEGYTCVLMDETVRFISELRGVKPLVQLIEQKNVPKGLAAADKVVGKATAFLYVLLGVKELYAKVISRQALFVLEANKICVQYENLVPNIINRKGDGICPFEESVMNIADAASAYEAILDKMKEMHIPIWD